MEESIGRRKGIMQEKKSIRDRRGRQWKREERERERDVWEIVNKEKEKREDK